MRILGIDPSLTSTGYAYTETGSDIKTGTFSMKKLKGLPRLCGLRNRVFDMLDSVRPALVVYEGYAMARFAGRAFDLGELGGILKLGVYERNIPILIVPPSCLKLFATGKGNADKDRVMVAMSKDRGKLFTSDDEADAYALCLMGQAFSSARHRPRDPRHYKHTALRGCSVVTAGAD